MRLEQADQPLAGRHRLAIEYPALGLGDDARDQRQVMVDFSAPERDATQASRAELQGFATELAQTAAPMRTVTPLSSLSVLALASSAD